MRRRHARFALAASRYACIDATQAPVDGSLRLPGRCRDDGGAKSGFGALAGRHRRRAPGEEVTTTTKTDTAVVKADHAVDKAADRLQEFANKAAAEGGLAAKIAPELADDAAFLRKLKPSLIAARAKGDAPKNEQPTEGTVAPVAPSGPQPAARRNRVGRRKGRARS